jgi:hypothetical protein
MGACPLPQAAKAAADIVAAPARNLRRAGEYLMDLRDELDLLRMDIPFRFSGYK